jgi:hypothetical protein
MQNHSCILPIKILLDFAAVVGYHFATLAGWPVENV